MPKNIKKKTDYRSFGKALLIIGIVTAFLNPIMGPGIAAIGLLLIYRPPGSKK